MTTCSQSNADSDIRQRDARAKSKMKAYADTRRRATPHDLHIGDFVLVRQQKKIKLSSFYDSRPYSITDINHSMITGKGDNHTVTRNSSFFKKLLGYSGKTQPIDQAEGDEEELTMTSP